MGRPEQIKLNKWYFDEDGPIRRVRGPGIQWKEAHSPLRTDGGWQRASIDEYGWALSDVERAASKLEIILHGLDLVGPEEGEL